MVASSGAALNQLGVVIEIGLTGSGYLRTDTDKRPHDRGNARSVLLSPLREWIVRRGSVACHPLKEAIDNARAMTDQVQGPLPTALLEPLPHEFCRW
jgi:hypothetical protein